MKKLIGYAFAISLLILSLPLAAQQNYRTRTSGAWNSPSTWSIESPNGSNLWVPAVSFPTSADGTITLLSGLTVTVTQDVSVDQLTMYSNSTLIVNNGIALTLMDGPGNDLTQLNNSHLHFLGESYIQGNGLALFAGQLYVYSANGTGAITPGVAATGNVRNATRVYSSALTVHYVGSSKQYIGAGHPTQAGVTTVINNASDVELNNVSGSAVAFNGNVSLLAGQLIVSNDDLTMNANTMTLGGGSLIMNSSVATRFNTLNNVTVNSGSIQITGGTFGNYLTVKGNLTLNGGNMTVVNNSSTTSITFTGNLNMQSGNISLSSGTGNLYSTYNGDIQGTGLITLSGSNNTVRINGSGAITHSFPFASGATFKSLEINRVGLQLTVPYSITLTSLTLTNGLLKLNTNLAISSTANFGAGSVIDFTGRTLQFNGVVNNLLSGGSLLGDASSTLTFSTSGSIGSFNFSAGSSLNTLTLDRFGVTLPVTSSVTVTSAINLVRGTLNNTSGLALSSGATINRQNLGNFTGSAPSGGPYNLTYTTGNLTLGPEIGGNIGNFTSNSWGTLTLNSALNLSGALTINTGTFTCGSNSVTAGSFLNASTFNAPSTNFTVNGNFTNNGTFNTNNGTVVLGGSGNIAGTTLTQFNNITLANSANFAIESNSRLRGTLTLGSNATFDADGASNNRVFTLLSSSDAGGGDASVGPIPSGSSVQGSVSVQRYWKAVDNVKRYISSPVTNSPVSQLQTSGIPVTGGFVGTSYPCTGCTNDYANLGWFDETARIAPAYAIGSSFKITPAQGSNNSEVLVPGRGYELYMWNGVNPSTWTSRGPINQGDFAFTVSYTSHGQPLQDGWNLVGNPYPSSITWEDNTQLPGGWSFSNNISSVVYVWDVSLQQWRDYNYSTNTGTLANGKIAGGQGFWVYVSNSNPATLVLHEQAKVALSGAYYRDNAISANRGFRVTASKKSESTTIEDHSFILSGIKEEIPKLELGDERLSLSVWSTEQQRELLYAENRDNVEEMPLSLLINEEGSVTIKIEGVGSEPDLDDFFVLDKKLDMVEKALDGYQFYVGASETGKIENRFYIVRGSKTRKLQESLRSFVAYPNPTSKDLHLRGLGKDIISIAIVNSLGELVQMNAVSDYSDSVMLPVGFLANGIYFVKVTYRDGRTSVQRIIKN